MDLLARLKKSVASVTLVAMSFLIGSQVALAALPFTDAAEIPSWSEEAISELMDQGVMSGNDDGSFAPNRQLNRAEVSKVIVLASGVDFDTTGGPHFPDVAEDAWYYDYIETMYNYGWVNGYPDGLFRPANGINRAEIAKMTINSFEIDQDLSGAPHFDDVNEGDWHYGYIETAYNNGLMRGYGDGTFGPANAVTRAETAHIVYNSQLVVAEPSGPAEGTLEVALSYDTPRGTNVPYNSTSVPYLTLEITASDDADTEISSLTFTRLGLGDNDDFDNVWFEIDGFKVGNDKSVNNDDIVELRFNPPVVVPAGQTIVADVVASAKYVDTDGDGNQDSGDDFNIGHHNRFALVSADDIASTAANVVGDFPIEGEEMEVAQYQVSNLKFSILGSNTTVDVGDNFIEIGKFRILNGSNTNKDVELRAITFKNDGTAEVEDNLENTALYVSGEQISAETIIDGDYVTFRLDNGVTGGYVIEDGDSRIFSIRADIVSAERNDTIQFKVDNYEDIVGVEIGTSFGVKAVYDSGAASSASCTSGTSNAEDNCALLKTYTIDSGDLNVSRDPSSLGNQDYAPGSNDVVMLTARLVVDQPLLVDGVHIWLKNGSTAHDDGTTYGGKDGTSDEMNDFNAAFDNFRLFLNDKLIDTENDFEQASGTGAISADNQIRLNFNTTFEIAGTSILKVVGNIADGAYGGDDQIKLLVAATDFQSPEYISTGDQVQNNQLLGSATGSYVEVSSSSVTIAETSGLSSGDNIVAGVDDVTFSKFVLDNNDSGDVNITSITVHTDSATNTNNTGDGVSGSARTYTNFTLAVFVDGTQQGSAKNLSTATSGCPAYGGSTVSSCGTATFNDLSVVIPSAGQKEFTIVVDTIEDSAASISTTPDAGQNETALGATADVDVASTSGMNVGDIIVWDNNGTDIVRAITGVTDSDSLALDSDLGANIPNGSSVTIRHQLKLDVTDVDADNVENGQSVTITEGGTALSVTNTLEGTMFRLIASGSLTVGLESTISADLLVAGQSNVEVLKVKLNAANDEVQVKDFYFENDLNNDEAVDNTAAGDRLDFKLYNEAGQLVQEKQMTGGKLHFDLANQDRIRVPKDDSTFVTVKVDVRNISQSNQTGKRLRLSLDNNLDTNKGIEAVTAATGNDITVPSATPWWEGVVNTVTSQDFVAYRSAIEVRHAATQETVNPSADHQNAYRFTVTADSAHAVQLGRLTFDVSLQGMQWDINGNTINGTKPSSATGLLTDDGEPAGETIVHVDTNAFTKFVPGDVLLFMDATTGAPDAIATVEEVRSATSIKVSPLLGAVDDNAPIYELTTSLTLAQVKRVGSNGQIDETSTVTSSIGYTNVEDNKARLTVNFSNQTIAAGASETYVLQLADMQNTTGSGATSDDDAVSVSIVTDSVYTYPDSLADQKAGESLAYIKHHATTASTTTTFTAASTSDAAKFVAGDRVVLIDDSEAANSHIKTAVMVTSVSGSTITVSPAWGAAPAANDHLIKLSPNTATGNSTNLEAKVIELDAVGGTENYKAASSADAAKFKVGDRVAFWDDSGESVTSESAVITYITGDTLFAGTGSAAATDAGVEDVLFLLKPPTANIVWSDESNTSHTTATNDWLNGYLVDIDTTAQTNTD